MATLRRTVGESTITYHAKQGPEIEGLKGRSRVASGGLGDTYVREGERGGTAGMSSSGTKSEVLTTPLPLQPHSFVWLHLAVAVRPQTGTM